MTKAFYPVVSMKIGPPEYTALHDNFKSWDYSDLYFADNKDSWNFIHISPTLLFAVQTEPVT